MLKELKARVSDLATLEHRLIDRGARFDCEIAGIDTYFKQPEGSVLKIVEDNTGAYFLRLQAHHGGFDIVEHRAIAPETDQPNAAIFSLRQQLTQTYGVHRTLKKRRRLYQLTPYTIELNAIDEVGNFIILISESPTEADMEAILGIAKPHYIRVPFSEL